MASVEITLKLHGGLPNQIGVIQNNSVPLSCSDFYPQNTFSDSEPKLIVDITSNETQLGTGGDNGTNNYYVFNATNSADFKQQFMSNTYIENVCAILLTNYVNINSGSFYVFMYRENGEIRSYIWRKTYYYNTPQEQLVKTFTVDLDPLFPSAQTPKLTSNRLQ